MPTFGATSRRENGKLLERSILGLGSLRRTTCPVGYGNAWRSSLLSLYGRAVADVKEPTVLLEPTQRSGRIAGIIVHYWRCDLLFTIRVLKWLLESLDCWKWPGFNPDFNPRNFCALVNDLKWGRKSLPIILAKIVIFRNEDTDCQCFFVPLAIG